MWCVFRPPTALSSDYLCSCAIQWVNGNLDIVALNGGLVGLRIQSWLRRPFHLLKSLDQFT